MIRINLLRSREKEGQQRIWKMILALVGCLGILAVIVLYSYFSNVFEIRKLDGQIASYNEEINRLQVLVRDVNKFKAEKEDLERRLNVIYTLKRAKTGPVRVLDELAMALPGKLWITSLKEKDGKMEMKGMAFDNPTIAQFMTNLEKTGVIKNVELVVSQQWERQELKLKEFTLTCQVSYASSPAGPAS
jgi:type IV pilus assembly protein PilN